MTTPTRLPTPRAYVIDTETTGTHPQASAIEVATLRLPLYPLYPVSNTAEVTRYAPQPDDPHPLSTPGARATHHILPDEYLTLTPHHHINLPPDLRYAVGHNITFDLRILRITPDTHPHLLTIDTLLIARRLLPDTQHSQSALLYYFTHDDPESLRCTRSLLKNAHSAGQDVENCARLLHHLLPLIPPEHTQSWSALANFSAECEIPTHAPFGKHKGLEITTDNIPEDYYLWAKNKAENFNPSYLEAMRRLYPLLK